MGVIKPTMSGERSRIHCVAICKAEAHLVSGGILDKIV